MAKPKNIDTGGCVTSYTKCIIYNGPDIPCLEIKTGDKLNEVLSVIAEEVCSVVDERDLSTLTIQCIRDKFIGTTFSSSPTILSYIQLLIDNQCTLKDLVDQIFVILGNQEPEDPLTLNLSCLTVLDGQGNPVPYTNQSVLQLLINQTCLLKGRITVLETTVVDLQDQIDNIDVGLEVLPNVTSCLYTNQRLDLATNVIAAKVCLLETRYGTAFEAGNALSAQPSSLNALFAANPNFIQIPDSISDTDNNQWILLSNLLDRMIAIEACACKVKCSDINLGFGVIDNESADGLVLDFSGDYGNVIDASFLDCGSIVTFIDRNKKQKTYPLVLEQEYQSPEFDLSMLDISRMIVIKVCAKLCLGEQQCCICTEQEHMLAYGCNFCTITASGDVTITYQTCSFT